MKLLRYKEDGLIQPGILDNENKVRNASSLVKDWNNLTVSVEILDIISDGWLKTIPFCGSGSYYYTFSTDNEHDGFDIYVLPSETDPKTFLRSKSGLEYVDCGEKDTMNFTHSCNVSADSKTVIHNYESYPIKINGQIVDKDVPKKPDMDYDEEAFEYDTEFLANIRLLFNESNWTLVCIQNAIDLICSASVKVLICQIWLI